MFDVLPHSTSSVYLFYDPHFSFLSPGTLSTLFEIETTKQYRRHGIDHYYMGYYIHSCSKMRYKAGFVPSQLLCPVTYQYRPFSECKPKLDRSKFARFADGEADEGEDRGKGRCGRRGGQNWNALRGSNRRSKALALTLRL